MRAIKYKYAIALDLSITTNEDTYIRDAISQAKEISDELEVRVRLVNPFNGKSFIFYSNMDSELIFENLK